MTHASDIDFVLLWVDGADPAWRAEFARYRAAARPAADGTITAGTAAVAGTAAAPATKAASTATASPAASPATVGPAPALTAAATPATGTPAADGTDASEQRYRDWGLLRYWFRGAERFAPWVRRIHLVTWGHLPPWLDRAHPKLRIVRHTDYIPAEWLPTFNSNVIELNLGRLEGLAERFVLFNDDTLLTAPCRASDFFRRGLPCDMARLSIVRPSCVAQTILNDLELINRLHPRRDLDRRLGKWLSPRYGLGNLLKTLSLLPWSFFPGFFDPHMPQAYLRTSFLRAWEQWGPELAAACRNRFRAPSDLSHWLVRYDALCRGEFMPRNFADTLLSDLDDRSIERVCSAVESGSRRMVCLNDSTDIADFDRSQQRLAAAFERLLPRKSAYEL